MSVTQLAIIGLGGISAAHRAAAQASGGVKFIAAVDLDRARRSAFEAETSQPAFESVDAMLADTSLCKRLEGVLICTPPSARIDIVSACFDAGLGVLIEKPIAHNLEAAQRLVEIADSQPGLPARVAYCHRYVPAVDAMRQLLEAGELGELVRFENTFACWHPTMRQHWMSDPSMSGGGSLIDTGSHGLDLFHYLCGKSRSVGLVERRGWAERGDSNATLLVETVDRDGPAVAGVLLSGWAEPARFLVSLVGTKAMVSYDYEKPESLAWLASDGERKTIAVESHESRFTRQLEGFAQLLADPDSDSRLCTFEHAAEVAQVLAGTQPLVS